MAKIFVTEQEYRTKVKALKVDQEYQADLCVSL
ncbi:MAG: hypothetical protein QOF19_3008 [Alphaproteobacteria bacterium]|jgi:hypothetical protein|nr:hypothetical protein [Alphaproteobacteria bacterium]